MQIVNEKLKNYIEASILPMYELNDGAHNLDHIFYVLNRAFNFSKKCENINIDMVYTIVMYHDVGHHIDAKNHEIVSAEILMNDSALREFFNEEEITIMKQAVEDHRASLEYEPRSIYGKIISSADRNTSLDSVLKRTYAYRLKHLPNANIDEIIEDSRKHIENKFGKNGYATEKMYFEDLEYMNYLEDVITIVNDKEAFAKRYKEVNNICD